MKLVLKTMEEAEIIELVNTPDSKWNTALHLIGINSDSPACIDILLRRFERSKVPMVRIDQVNKQ